MTLWVRCGAVECKFLRKSTTLSGVTRGPRRWKFAFHRRCSIALVCVAEDARAEGSVTGVTLVAIVLDIRFMTCDSACLFFIKFLPVAQMGRRKRGNAKKPDRVARPAIAGDARDSVFADLPGFDPLHPRNRARPSVPGVKGEMESDFDFYRVFFGWDERDPDGMPHRSKAEFTAGGSQNAVRHALAHLIVVDGVAVPSGPGLLGAPFDEYLRTLEGEWPVGSLAAHAHTLCQ